MSDRSRRRSRILDHIQRGGVSRQDVLCELLARDGIVATQATLSRDLRDLGIVKGPDGYRLPTNNGHHPSGADFGVRTDLFSTCVRRVELAGCLVVIKTGPGQAQAIASEMDARAFGELAGRDLVGTVAGDDTIFVASVSIPAARRLRDLISREAGLGS